MIAVKQIILTAKRHESPLLKYLRYEPEFENAISELKVTEAVILTM
jgi:hypothetical protein